jgi:hypothetical protein
MNRLAYFLFLLSFSFLGLSVAKAQDSPIPRLIWKVNKLDIGTVLEENGLQEAEFEFTLTQDSLFFIEDVWLECGCTSVDYTKDTLKLGESGSVKVSFDPTSAYGFFSKLIVVKGNLSGLQDSLYLEGISIPYPTDLGRAYPARKGPLGFRLNKVNMGDVFDNEPKIKYVEFFNFGDVLLDMGALRVESPVFLDVVQVQQFVRAQERGLLMIRYDGGRRNDLGFFEDKIQLKWADQEVVEIELDIIANLFEYFPPFSKDRINDVPQLFVDTKEINLGDISSRTLVRRTVRLTNRGRETLEIRKIQGNCECLKIEAPKTNLEAGDSMELSLTFDPTGRKGIDQRNIYIFSNDPMNPVQSIVIKSRIE